MAFSRHSSLNPNADPFLYTTPFLNPPSKLEFAPLPIPVIAPLRVLWGLPAPAPAPVHGCGSSPYVDDPYQFGFYDVVVPPVSSSWPCRCLGSHPEMKSERKCKTIGKWVPQKKDDDHDPTLQHPSPPQFLPFDLETTTLMIKNIPNQFRRRHLLNILDEHCKRKNRSCDHQNNSFDIRRSEYDFVYLPMDFRKFWYDGKISNLGYAFVNFTSPTAASGFCKAYHRRQWDVVVNKKVCEIKRAKLQGLKALTGAFRNKIFWCHANNYLPVVLEPPSDGCRSYRATPIGKRVARPPPNPMRKCG